MKEKKWLIALIKHYFFRRDINDVFDIIFKYTVTQTYSVAESIYWYSENYFIILKKAPFCLT